MAITMDSEDSGVCFVACCKNASIEQKNGKKCLEVYLSSDALVANHGNPALRGKEGITLLDELFGKKEDMEWGDAREKLMTHDLDYKLTIANEQHPVRWTAGRSLVVINGYAALHLRPKFDQPNILRLADLGGFGDKEDLFDPAKGIHREVAEELLILDKYDKLVVPVFRNPRAVRYSPLSQIAAQETDLYYAGIEKAVALERTDLAQDSTIRIHLDGQLRHEENLLFRYDPRAHCGIDVLMPIEYRVEQDVRDLRLGFGEYWHDERNEKVILGKEQNMVFVKIDDLIEEFDRERPRFLQGHMSNAYTGAFQDRRFHPHLITSSVREQLRVMKQKDYRFSL